MKEEIQVFMGREFPFLFELKLFSLQKENLAHGLEQELSSESEVLY